MTTLIEVINHGPIRELRLARPPVNALDTELCRALIVTLNQAMADDVQGVVLSGSERIFTGGMDVPYLLRHGEDKHKLLDSWQAFFGATRTLAESRIPVVAALTGHSPAGGCVLALCCDYRVMARSIDPAKPFVIGLNEVQVGLTMPRFAIALCRQRLTPASLHAAIATARPFDPPPALSAGFVDELVDPATLHAAAREHAVRLAAYPAAAFEASKRRLVAPSLQALEQAIAEDVADWRTQASTHS